MQSVKILLNACLLSCKDTFFVFPGLLGSLGSCFPFFISLPFLWRHALHQFCVAASDAASLLFSLPYSLPLRGPPPRTVICTWCSILGASLRQALCSLITLLLEAFVHWPCVTLSVTPRLALSMLPWILRCGIGSPLPLAGSRCADSFEGPYNPS